MLKLKKINLAYMIILTGIMDDIIWTVDALCSKATIRTLYVVTDRINSLFSLISRLPIHRMPCMHDSSTCAPWAPRLLQLMSSSISMVDSLHANPSSKFLQIQYILYIIYMWQQCIHRHQQNFLHLTSAFL